jgi:hypothetical protein
MVNNNKEGLLYTVHEVEEGIKEDKDKATTNSEAELEERFNLILNLTSITQSTTTRI